MKKLFESWRKYKLLLEEEEEQDTPDKELRKQVYPKDLKTIPIQKWADKWGFTLRELDPGRLMTYLGKGAYGRAFAAVKNGKEYAVKIGDSGREDEMKIINKMIDIRDSLPPNVARHVIKFYSPSDLGFEDTVTDDRGVLYHVSVAELLEPLTDGDRKKLDSTRYGGNDNIEVAKNPFWSNEDWGEIETSLDNKLENTNAIKRLFIDALYQTRNKITKPERLNLLLYSKDPNVRAERPEEEEMLKNLNRPALVWDKIWVEMIMNKLTATEKGKALMNYYIKKLDMQPPDALGSIWQIVEKAGKIIFFSNIPVDYFSDDGTLPDNAPPGELKDFHKAMEYLRDEAGIMPNDLHPGNIMRRGRDWVVMDIGLFET